MSTMNKHLFTRASIERARLQEVSEASVQEAILGYLRARRIPHTITEAKQSFNHKGQQVCRIKSGWPDITICFEGFFVGCEVKRPIGGRLRYLQALELDALWRNGALVVIARDVEQVIDLLITKQTSQATKDEIAACLAKGPQKGR